MNRFINLLIFMVCFAVPTSLLAEQLPYPSTQAAVEEEVAQLPWQTEVRSYHLATSSSDLHLPKGFMLLTDEAAARFMFLSQGTEYPDVDAVVVDPNNFAVVFLEYIESGYVNLDDWNELDSAILLDQIIENTKKANEERRQNGVEELGVKGWRIEPTLDREQGFVYWAIDAMDGGALIVNAIALKLGRKGFEKLTWVGSADLYSAPGGFLQAMIDAHQYKSGYKYADYSIGDKIAAFGIAALVSASAGGKTKAGKATIAAIGLAVLAFAKKFILVPILIGVGAIGAMLKRIFGRKNASPTST